MTSDLEPDLEPEGTTPAQERHPEPASEVSQQPSVGGEQRYERERAQFRALILANPNYFGNLAVSPFTPVLNIQSNTFYEEIGCVGFQPQFNRLEAVVYINQPAGYGGGVCSPGTPEYVRFYMSFDNGATWQDLGLTSFTAYDIPPGTEGAKRLEYAVTLQIDPRRRFCFVNNLAQVRAILSWNVPPPPNDPNFVPVWGNVHHTHIQIDPFDLISLDDILSAAKITLPPEFAAAVDMAQAIPGAPRRELSLAERRERYREKGVEPHRLAMPELQQLLSQPTLSASIMAPGAQSALANLGIELGDLSILFPTDGSTRYEELECVGLNPNQDTLVGVIRIKRPAGYGGDPCEAGSREYVTFWGDFNHNGFFETCLGTTSVEVHDIDTIPREGLEYAVFLPVDLNRYRKPCLEGPVVVRIRAILSWIVAPPCGNPNYVPVWGNREETLIHIKPGTPTVPGVHNPIIQTAGSMDVDFISPLTGLANGSAALAGFVAEDSPFGGLVIITGHIGDPPDISAGAANLKYRVEVSDDGFFTQEYVTNSFSLGRDQLLNGIWSNLSAVTQAVDVDGYYDYQEDVTDGLGNAMIFPVGNVLARWQTGGKTGLWQMRIRVKNPGMGPDWFSNVVTLRLDNAGPGASIAITSGGGDCADFTIGDVISGTYAVSDEHVGSLSFSVLPTEIGGNPTGGSFTAPSPLPPSSTTMPLVRTSGGGVPTLGEAGAWSLDTAGMPACGYVVVLTVTDRTIVNSGSIGFQSQDVVGLCLKVAES
jgi:hypothetical protein